MPREHTITTRKWAYAEHALQYAHEMLDRMVDLARNAQSEQVRLMAQDKILDRAMGKAPQHIDTSAVRHTEIVYRSAEEIRQELLARGVPQVLLDYTPPAPEPSADSDKP
jgi:ppGpp synthetase/RelA/SpoT-type nucleotidyltranferase